MFFNHYFLFINALFFIVMKVVVNAQLIKFGKSLFHGATRFDTVNGEGHRNSKSMIVILFIIPNSDEHLVYDDENSHKRIHFADLSPLR